MRIFANLVAALITMLGINLSLVYAQPVSLTPLNAKFETIECALPCKKSGKVVKSEWWMLRNAAQVELRKAGAPNSELWTKLENNQLNYQFLMHEEKRVIEYLPVDLNMLGITVNETKWQAITSLVTQDDLATLKKTISKKQHQGLNLEIYSGLLNGLKTNITWIPALQIPLQMKIIYPKYQLTINLLRRYTDELPITATTTEIVQTYEHVDYTDIGDLEHSAVAKKWLVKANGAPGIHSHETHQH